MQVIPVRQFWPWSFTTPAFSPLAPWMGREHEKALSFHYHPSLEGMYVTSAHLLLARAVSPARCTGTCQPALSGRKTCWWTQPALFWSPKPWFPVPLVWCIWLDLLLDFRKTHVTLGKQMWNSRPLSYQTYEGMFQGEHGPFCYEEGNEEVLLLFLGIRTVWFLSEVLVFQPVRILGSPGCQWTFQILVFESWLGSPSSFFIFLKIIYLFVY